MGIVIVTLRIMPESPETGLEPIKSEASKLIGSFGGKVGKIEVQEVAFGLKSIMIMFSLDEKIGGTEGLEKEISAIEGVNRAETIDVRRAIG